MTQSYPDWPDWLWCVHMVVSGWNYNSLEWLADGVAGGDVDLGAVECTIARVNLPIMEDRTALGCAYRGGFCACSWERLISANLLVAPPGPPLTDLIDLTDILHMVMSILHDHLLRVVRTDQTDLLHMAISILHQLRDVWTDLTDLCIYIGDLSLTSFTQSYPDWLDWPL
jgi:hypothetical protein